MNDQSFAMLAQPPHARTPSFGRATSTIVAASLAMAATLPGRTHGLGLATTRLLEDFPTMGEVGYARINLLATLAGSIFCLPCGWWLDRRSPREVASLVTAALACTVVGMASATTVPTLALGILATRAIGQSMLSVVSLSIIGKSFPGRPGHVMGAYAVIMTMLMAVATWWLGEQITATGWRDAWARLGWGLLALSPIVGLCAPPRTIQAQPRAAEQLPAPSGSATLSQALLTPCFWTFALGISLFGMASSGVSLFQQSIFADRGLNEELYHRTLVLGLLVGLVSNLGFGWLATRISLHRLLTVSLLGLAASLGCLPYLQTETQAYLFCIAYALAGGGLTVLFFTVWGQAFGPQWLASIQGGAQMLTVIASALGPVVVTEVHKHTGTYSPVLWGLAFAAASCGLAALATPVPSAAASVWSNRQPNPQGTIHEVGHDK